MLNPIFARAGSNKSDFVVNTIRRLLGESNRKVMLLVPEQSSFETEKEMYLSLGDRDFSRLEVVSFTRLCSLISARFGSKSGQRLSGAGKMILASCALEKSAPQLKVYAGQTLSTAFAEKSPP